MGLKQTVEPTKSPVTLEEQKLHSYVKITNDDTLIQSMIDTSTSQLEDYTGLQLEDATYVQTLNEWSNEITLLKSPAKSITSIQYYDEDNNLQTLDSSIYALDDFSLPSVLIQNENTTLPNLKNKQNSILITYVAGVDNSGTITPKQKETLKAWIKLQTATYYENRETFTVGINTNNMPNRFAINLLDNFKVL